MYFANQIDEKETNPICMLCLSHSAICYETYDGIVCKDCLKDYIKDKNMEDLKEAIECNSEDFVDFYYDESFDNKNTSEALWEHLSRIFESKEDERKTHMIEKMIEFCFEDLDYFLKVLNIEKVRI